MMIDGKREREGGIHDEQTDVFGRMRNERKGASVPIGSQSRLLPDLTHLNGPPFTSLIQWQEFTSGVCCGLLLLPSNA